MSKSLLVFARNLSKIRKLRGYTQRHLAELCGLSLNTIAYYESKRQWPSPESLKKLASVLQVHELDFFKEEMPTTVSHAVPLLSREQLKQLIPQDLALEVISDALKKLAKLRT